MITVGSVCSGIEAASVAWRPLGMRFAWHSEIERFPCAVLDHHYPETPNLGDVTKITEADLERHGPIDLLVGGTPCQSFSVAGLRKGLADPRGNLALRFIQLATATRARWVVWENVPGVLSSGRGRDFGAFLGGLAQLGYGFAYRILDAQYFGVPQRRRRVFVVGYLGDWRRAAAVLSERESLRRNPPPSREAGAGVAHALARGACGSHGRYDPNGEDYVTCPDTSNQYGDHESRESLLLPVPLQEVSGRQSKEQNGIGIGIGVDADVMYTLQSGQQHGVALPFDTTQVTSNQNYSNPQPGDPCHPLAEGQHPPAVAFRTSGNCGVMEQGDKTAALNCGTDQNQNIVAYGIGSDAVDRSGEGDGSAAERAGLNVVENLQPSLRARANNSVASGMAVRRLTPTECERLQGFPDDWTKVPYRNKPADQCPDGPRYKALGNSMAVPVMAWIGQRILEAEGG